jgi:hypothetical protein
MCDEVVMIRKYAPSLKELAVVTRYCQQAAVQHSQAVGATEVVGLEIRARRDEVSATHRELVCRRVWPRRGRLGHWAILGHGE